MTPITQGWCDPRVGRMARCGVWKVREATSLESKAGEADKIRQKQVRAPLNAWWRKIGAMRFTSFKLQRANDVPVSNGSYIDSKMSPPLANNLNPIQSIHGLLAFKKKKEEEDHGSLVNATSQLIF